MAEEDLVLVEGGALPRLISGAGEASETGEAGVVNPGDAGSPGEAGVSSTHAPSGGPVPPKVKNTVFQLLASGFLRILVR